MMTSFLALRPNLKRIYHGVEEFSIEKSETIKASGSCRRLVREVAGCCGVSSTNLDDPCLRVS
jgi:hypothetical protein